MYGLRGSLIQAVLIEESAGYFIQGLLHQRLTFVAAFEQPYIIFKFIDDSIFIAPYDGDLHGGAGGIICEAVLIRFHDYRNLAGHPIYIGLKVTEIKL